MNVWIREISLHPIEDVKKILENYDEKLHKAILNGNWKTLQPFSPIQYLLFHNPYKYRKVVMFLLEKGVDLNFKCKKGVNFFQLYILLFFYDKSFQDDNVVNFFIELLKYGIEINNPIIFSTTNIYTMIDIVQQLQKKSVVSKVFFPKHYTLKHRPLPTDLFYKIYTSLLCYGAKFYKVYPFFTVNNMNIYNFTSFLETSSLIKNYLIERFKLPLNISNKEIEKRILFLYKNKDHVIRYFHENESNNPIISKNNFQSTAISNHDYLNLDYIPNSYLQSYEYLSEIDNVIFHKSFFPILFQTKINPYNRKILKEFEIKCWQNEMKFLHNFPIVSIEDSLQTNSPYFFYNLRINDKNFKQKSVVSFLEHFFNINHPYQQITKIMYFKKHEIQYFSHVIYYETSLFKKFKKTLDNPNKDLFLKILFYYCKLNIKFVNILYFLMEEILNDLKCFEVLKDYVETFDENPILVYNQYYARFGTTNPHYLDKFLENMILIYNFSKK
jgi:hypothetical protein